MYPPQCAEPALQPLAPAYAQWSFWTLPFDLCDPAPQLCICCSLTLLLLKAPGSSSLVVCVLVSIPCLRDQFLAGRCLARNGQMISRSGMNGDCLSRVSPSVMALLPSQLCQEACLCSEGLLATCGSGLGTPPSPASGSTFLHSLASQASLVLVHWHSLGALTSAQSSVLLTE